MQLWDQKPLVGLCDPQSLLQLISPALASPHSYSKIVHKIFKKKLLKIFKPSQFLVIKSAFTDLAGHWLDSVLSTRTM